MYALPICTSPKNSTLHLSLALAKQSSHHLKDNFYSLRANN